MKPRNLIIAENGGRLLCVGDALLSGAVKKKLPKPLGYGAGRLRETDSFAVFVPDAAKLKEERCSRYAMKSCRKPVLSSQQACIPEER